MKRLLLLLELLAACPWTVRAQSSSAKGNVGPSWQECYEQWQDMTDEDNTLSEENFEFLQNLTLNKLNLNTATREQLEQLPFLSAQQIEELVEYGYRYGGMTSLGELKMIRSLDVWTRTLLLQFVMLSPPAAADTVRHGHDVHQRLVVMAKLPTYARKGDRTAAADGGYIGPQWKHSWRYALSVDNRWSAALLAAQDAGEPFFRDGNKTGWDYYSFYVLYRPPSKPAITAWQRPRHFVVRDVVAGRYRMRMAMGLVLNSNYSFGKAGMLQSLGRPAHLVSGHASRSEANFLQGAAATVALRQTLESSVEATAFFSYRKIDATLDGDGNIRTILTTGYHRTLTEMERRRNAAQTAYGGNLNWRWRHWHAGLTAAATTFDKRLAPDKRQLYRRWNAEGKGFWNASVDYGYTASRLSINGETATGDGGGWATVNSASWQAASTWRLVALQRFYSYRYHALLARSFSEGGSVQNESGAYVGAEWSPGQGWRLSGYTDIAYFAWARYRASMSSHAWDNMLSAVYATGGWTFHGRWRLKRREYDNSDKTSLYYKTTQRGRLYARYDGGSWHELTQLNVAFVSGQGRSRGWMVTQQGGWSWRWLHVYATASWFHTDDYDSRLYAYERGPLFTYSVPAMFGKGVHYAFMLRSDIGKWFYLLAKVSVTDYFDRSHISSGMQEIDRSSQTELEVQLSIKL